VATIRKVASEAEVSTATVSRVLNSRGAVSDAIRQRVLHAANRLGYSIPHRSATNFIALAYTGRSSLSSPYDNALLDGMAEAASESPSVDLAILRLQVDRQPGESYGQMLHRKGIRAAVLRTNVETRSVCVELAQEGFPSIVVGDRFPNEAVSYFCCDSRPCSYQAVEHLISLGHRRIAIAISHIPDSDHLDRLASYEQALKDHDIEIDPRLVLRVWAMRPNGAQVLRTIMSASDRPTAIYVADPLVAVGLINQAHVMGVRIPEDLSVIGFDDGDARHNVFPELSAVCQDARQMGYEAMSALTQMLLNERTEPIQKTSPSWLELHGTTGQPPVAPVRILPDGTRLAASPANATVSTHNTSTGQISENK
jgi:DNA-binding LacI/PurR family transcriptional regulator